MSEFEKHTVIVHNQINDGNIKSIRILNKYDPQLMFINTPESTDNFIFQSAARHPNGVNLVYSYSRDGSEEIQLLGLSGGTKEDKKEIVYDFDQMLHLNAEGEKWIHISEPLLCKNGAYKWIIHFGQ
jgi:hypothetical protein